MGIFDFYGWRLQQHIVDCSEEMFSSAVLQCMEQVRYSNNADRDSVVGWSDLEIYF